MEPPSYPIELGLLKERLDQINEQVRAACSRVGREPGEITLVGVTKTFPIEVIKAGREVGLTDFGENKVQELARKAKGLPGQTEKPALRYHMIGHLQRNKVKDVIKYADVFHTLDSLRLADTLDRRCHEAGRVLPCLVQVNVSGETSKYGLEPNETHAFLDSLTEKTNLEIIGLMTLAAPLPIKENIRPQFTLLRKLLTTYRRNRENHPALRHLSMGMSNDFEMAIEEGATLIRIGSGLFGQRHR